MQIAGVYGSKKSARESVLVRLEIGGIEINERSARDFGGQVVYASNPAYRGYEHWWVFSVDIPEGTSIRIETMVGVYGKGRDSDRSVVGNFVADEAVSVVEFRVHKIGPKKYPLLKGKLRRLSESSAQDKTDQTIEGMFSEVEEDA
jgi:hypothetical protein